MVEARAGEYLRTPGAARIFRYAVLHLSYAAVRKGPARQRH